MVGMMPPGMAKTASLVREKTKKPVPASATTAAESPFSWAGYNAGTGPQAQDASRDLWANALENMSGVYTPDPLSAVAKVAGMGLAGYGTTKAIKAKEQGTADYRAKLAQVLSGETPDNQALMGMMADPYADENSQRMLMGMWERNNPTEAERLDLEGKRLSNKAAQMEIDQANQPPESKPQIVPKGAQVYDNGQWITPPQGPQAQQQAIDDPMKISKDYQNQPGFDRLKQITPTINSMMASLDDPSAMADLDFVYGLAKILDPTSVVRESEAGMVIDSQGIAPSLLGQLNKIISGNQAMLPEVRKNLVGVALRRAQQLQQQAEEERKFYGNMAEQNGYDPNTYLQPVPGLPDLPVDDEGFTQLPNGSSVKQIGP